MNLVEWHNRIDFWADKFKSPRYTKKQRDIALNASIDAFVKDRFDNIKRPGSYSFEITERVREELYPIIVDDYPLILNNKRAFNPPSFMYHLVTFMTINGKRVLCKLRTYNENDLENNSFTRATDRNPLHRKTATGFIFDTGSYSPTSIEMTYLKTPSVVSWDTTPISSGANVLVIGKRYYVASASVTHAAVTYPTGQVFTAVVTAMLGAGTVNLLNETELPEITHEEICKMATAMLTGTFEDYQKGQMMNAESMRS